MRKNFVILGMVAATLLASSCASKKDLQNCQNENRELSTNYQNAKEELAAAKARAASLEAQIEQQKKDYAALQRSLDQSLSNASSNNVNISKLVDQINESNQYIRHLVEVKSKSDSLNMVLTNNLTRSLSKEEMKCRCSRAWYTSRSLTTCSTRVARTRLTTGHRRPCQRLRKSSWTTRTTTC